MTSTMSRIGMSVTWGPCQLPQQRWKRTRSLGSPRSAWLRASTRIMESFRYSSTVGAGLIMSQFSAMAGSSSWSTRPASRGGPILLAHRLRAREDQLLFGAVVLVANARDAAGCDGGHEALGRPHRGQRRLHVRDIRADRLLARVDERSSAHGEAHAGPPTIGRDAGVGIRVGSGEERAITAVRVAREADAARFGSLGGNAIELHAQLEAAQTLERVAPPCAVVDPLSHGLAEFAVAWHVDARRPLTTDDLHHGGSEPLLVGALV